MCGFHFLGRFLIFWKTEGFGKELIMLSEMKHILNAIESCVSRLNQCLFEKRFSDMPYLLGAMTAYNELLQDFVNVKISESAESSET